MNQEQVLRIKAAADMFDANRRMEAAFAEAQATNQAMMKQLRVMSEAMSHPAHAGLESRDTQAH